MKLLKAVLWTAPIKEAAGLITREVSGQVREQVSRQVFWPFRLPFRLPVLDQVSLQFTVEK